MSESKTIQIPLKGVGGEDKGSLEISADSVDCRVRYPLLKEAAVMYLANRRVGTHETKTRAEVAGSTKKPWKQKGTGRARAGTRKSPLWRGGGIIFGPHMRDYSYAINRKQRRLAVRSALLSKLQAGEVVVIDGLNAGDKPRTKPVAAALQAIGVRGRCLLGTGTYDKNLYLSARNIEGVTVAPVKEFNALDVLNARTIVLTRDAFDSLTASLAEAGSNAGEESGGKE